MKNRRLHKTKMIAAALTLALAAAACDTADPDTTDPLDPAVTTSIVGDLATTTTVPALTTTTAAG